MCRGDIATLYLNSFEAAGKKQHVVIKAAREAADADLMLQEATVLQALHKKLPEGSFRTFVPKLFDSQQFPVKSGVPVQINVLELFPGFFDLVAVRNASPIEARDLVWIWKRIMGLLTWVHSIKHIHGAILPPHIMVFPDNDKRLRADNRTHSIRLVDWCYAVDYRTEKSQAWCPQYREFYPPEILKKQAVNPGTDLYMAAKCMVYLVGGDVKTNKMPDVVPNPLQMVLKRCMTSNIDVRMQNAKEGMDQMNFAAQEAFGNPQFHEFLLPGI